MDALARYRLVRLIKRGGTAELFEATMGGHEGFQRRVAIKRLLAEHAEEPALIDNFVDEANIASQLHHANIVGVFDFGLMDGLPFQVLELVDGLDLASLTTAAAPAGRAVPAEVSLHIASEIAHALDYAHRAKGLTGDPLGIVHRDVSPENILVSWAGDVKLTDFGIARAFERRAPTTVNVARGKLPYMAPEQLRGEIVDARADIFALGCVLHWLLTGKSPMADEAARRGVVAGGRVVLDPSLPEDLRRLIGRATDTLKSARTSSAATLAGECTRAIHDRISLGGRSALQAFLEKIEPAMRAAVPHPLQALQDIELVLRDASRNVRRFQSFVATPGETQTTLTPTAPDDSKPLEASAARDALLGQEIDGYRFLEVLGQGGFATVYRARDLGSGAERAIKVLLRSPPDHVIRIRREAEALAKLDHPSLVRVEKTGALEDGRPYLVMELVRGPTLRSAIMEAGRFSDERAGAVARQIAQGLQAAHQLGLVHRDLTPSNVLLGKADGVEHVKIVDFGLALLLGEATEAQTRLTRVGAAVGTPRWMAPEQIVAGDIGPATDLYALGALLYRMVEGVSLFHDVSDVKASHLHEKPPPLRGGSRFGPLISRLLEKDPSRRPKDAGEVVRWIDRILGSRPRDASTDVTPPVASPAPLASPGPLASPVPLASPAPLASPVPLASPAPLASSAPAARRSRDSVIPSASAAPISISVSISRGLHRGRLRATLALAVALALAVIAWTVSQLRFTRQEDAPVRPAAELPAPARSAIAEPTAVAGSTAEEPEEPAAPLGPSEPAKPSEPPEPSEPSEPSEPVVAPASDPNATGRTARTPRRAERRTEARSIDALDTSLSAMLADRGLDRSDLAEIAATGEALRSLARARRERDDEGARRALMDLSALVRALPMDADLAQRRLARTRQRLSRLAPTLEREALAELERRYLDLRSQVSPSMSEAEINGLVKKIDALDRDLDDAAP
ncbi:MAG: protein kinase [Deltaproteobacteria bacterium]|nr:protein kinase [Deltaproteobacteria bacterium]